MKITKDLKCNKCGTNFVIINFTLEGSKIKDITLRCRCDNGELPTCCDTVFTQKDMSDKLWKQLTDICWMMIRIYSKQGG